MEILTLKEILSAVKGVLLGASKDIEHIGIKSITIDSRVISRNSLFIPLHGEKINSHNFINKAFENGAIAALIDEDVELIPNFTYIKVENTLNALQNLAAFYRRKFDIPVIGITGSVGKTSTKEMISCVLESKYNVVKTQGNLNGQIGLPLTIFNIENEHDVAILEMGISEPNEMDKLSYIAAPNYAVISNIGVTHIENFGTRNNILNEKINIIKTLSKDSTLLINTDNDLLKSFKKHCSKSFKIKGFGINDSSDFFAESIRMNEENTEFDFVFDGRKEKIEIPVIGNHNIYNALSAIAFGLEFNISMNDIKDSLRNYKTLKMRQCIDEVIFEGKKITVIDDTYNANPDSMESAINVLSILGKDRRKVAILADMLELGEYSDKLHFEVGEFVSKKEIDILLTIGEKSKYIAKGAQSFSDKNIKIMHFMSNNDCFDYLKNLLNINDIILLKGSRGMHLEEIVNKITEKV